MPPKNSRKSSQKQSAPAHDSGDEDAAKKRREEERREEEARFFPSRCSQVNAGSATILHGPSGGPTVSTRFNTVHPGRAPLPGPPRFTTVVFDMSKTTGKTPGSSRSIRHPSPSRWHYGSTLGTPRFTPVNGPG